MVSRRTGPEPAGAAVLYYSTVSCTPLITARLSSVRREHEKVGDDPISTT